MEKKAVCLTAMKKIRSALARVVEEVTGVRDETVPLTDF